MNQNLPVSTWNISWPTEQDVTIKTMYTSWILLQNDRMITDKKYLVSFHAYPMLQPLVH